MSSLQEGKDNRCHPTKTHHHLPNSKPHQNHLHKTRPTAMPTDTLANACYFGSDMPICPRNPHTRKRQNINRNVRLHLRNDRKLVQNDLLLAKTVHDNHFVFYCALSSFETWYHTRQLFPHDRTLIRQWAAIYRQGENKVLQLQLMPNTQQATQMMARLLVQPARKTHPYHRGIWHPLFDYLSQCLTRGILLSTRNAWNISAHICTISF